MSIDTGRKDELSRRQEAFWKVVLSGAPELLAIQTDYPRPAVLGPEVPLSERRRGHEDVGVPDGGHGPTAAGSVRSSWPP